MLFFILLLISCEVATLTNDAKIDNEPIEYNKCKISTSNIDISEFLHINTNHPRTLDAKKDNEQLKSHIFNDKDNEQINKCEYVPIMKLLYGLLNDTERESIKKCYEYSCIEICKDQWKNSKPIFSWDPLICWPSPPDDE